MMTDFSGVRLQANGKERQGKNLTQSGSKIWIVYRVRLKSKST